MFSYVSFVINIFYTFIFLHRYTPGLRFDQPLFIILSSLKI